MSIDPRLATLFQQIHAKCFCEIPEKLKLPSESGKLPAAQMFVISCVSPLIGYCYDNTVKLWKKLDGVMLVAKAKIIIGLDMIMELNNYHTTVEEMLICNTLLHDLLFEKKLNPKDICAFGGIYCYNYRLESPYGRRIIDYLSYDTSYNFKLSENYRDDIKNKLTHKFLKLLNINRYDAHDKKLMTIFGYIFSGYIPHNTGNDSRKTINFYSETSTRYVQDVLQAITKVMQQNIAIHDAYKINTETKSYNNLSCVIFNGPSSIELNNLVLVNGEYVSPRYCPLYTNNFDADIIINLDEYANEIPLTYDDLYAYMIMSGAEYRRYGLGEITNTQNKSNIQDEKHCSVRKYITDHYYTTENSPSAPTAGEMWADYNRSNVDILTKCKTNKAFYAVLRQLNYLPSISNNTGKILITKLERKPTAPKYGPTAKETAQQKRYKFVQYKYK